jgi:hypothetical protein
MVSGTLWKPSRQKGGMRTMNSKLFEHIKRTQRENKRRLFWWRMTLAWLAFSIFTAGVAVGRMI